MPNNWNDDKRISEKLERWTEVDQDIQSETWEKIDQQLFQGKKQRNIMGRYWAIAISAAIIFIAMFGSMTETGQAVVQEVKDLFVAEKQQDMDIEGNLETTDVELHANETLDYVIYIDKDFYKMEVLEDVDRIVPKEPLGADYPEVYMEITQEIGTTKDVIIEEITEKLLHNELLIVHEETVSDPIEATMFEGIERDNVTGEIRNEWDSIVRKYLLVEISSEQFFVIKQAYFLEASEGHGARFHHMLKSFEVIK